MLKKEDFSPIGKLSRTHGIKGEISARLDVDLSSLFEDEDSPLFLMLEENGLLIPMRVEGWRTKLGDVDLLKFTGIDTPEEATPWLGSTVWLDKSLLGEEEEGVPSMDEPQHFVGYTLYASESGQAVGRITDVDQSTLNTLLCVEASDGAEHLIPLAQELIEHISVADKRLTLHIPQGLLDDDGEYA